MAWRRTKKDLPTMTAVPASQVPLLELQPQAQMQNPQQIQYSNVLPMKPVESSPQWVLQEVLLNQNRFRVFVNPQTGESLDLYEAILHIINNL